MWNVKLGVNLISICDVSYIYPRSEKFALENINISIDEGEFLAVMGENGSGKTTFCKLINGIIPHLTGGRLTGNVLIGDINIKDTTVPRMADKIGMVFDDPDAQFFTSIVRHEASFGPENILLPPEEINERVDFALRVTGLAGFEERLPSTLSGGEKQRLSIAAALAMKSKILVLDEPLCRLDPDGMQEVLTVLNEIKGKFRITIIMSSHNSDLMMQYADRVCVLNKGKIVALDNVENIFGCNNLLEENGILPVLNTKLFKSNCLNKADSDLDIFHKLAPVRAGSRSNFSELINPVIEVKNFSFNYKNGVSIKNINLSIAEKDFIALIGKNGCGKTTLLKNITGLLNPSGTGDIFICGKNTKDLKTFDISKEIGYVMQNPDSQLFTDTVKKEVSFALKNMKISKAEINQRAEEALKIVGLNSFDDFEAFPHALKRADRIKLLIACVLAMGSRIIILDEFDAGLDYNDCQKIMKLLMGLNSKGFTIIFVSHNMFLVKEYAKRIIKMSRDGAEELIQ